MNFAACSAQRGWKRVLVWVVVAGMAATACGADSGGAAPTSTATDTAVVPTPAAKPDDPTATSAPATPTEEPTATAGATATATQERVEIDLSALPLGDGKLSSSPQVGYVWACQTNFQGGGAEHAGDWIKDNGTWDSTAKITVDGANINLSEMHFHLGDVELGITGNGMPDHPTGNFPISPSDDAYQYDCNPNAVEEQSIDINIPRHPELAGSPSCVPQGPIGILMTGSVLFNALDAAGRDAAAHEVQDMCGGHPESTGQYHYHDLSSCWNPEIPGEHSELAGYSFDGFGIYGQQGEGGVALTNEDLDACHGHTHEVLWDFETVEIYHYHATYEYPYTSGCYMGEAVRLPNSGGPPPRP